MIEEIIICNNEKCKNDLCPHCMYAAPVDGTEVRLKDLFGEKECPCFRDKKNRGGKS